MPQINIEKTKELLKKDDIQVDSFALKILLQQQRVRCNLSNDEQTLTESIKKIEEFFNKMKSLDTVKRDFKKIYGRELDA